MKALVTGVTGRIGANLAAGLLARGYTVRGLVMPNDPKVEKARRLGVEILEADLSDLGQMEAATEGVDIVAHLAAEMVQGQRGVDRMLVINTIGTANLLEGASRAGVSRFVYASTDQTYSPFVAERTTFNEDHVQQPRDIYGLGKFLSEQACLSWQREYGVPITILRYSSVLAGDEALTVLGPAWLSTVITRWTEAGRVPWFGTDKVAEAQSTVATLADAPNAACGVSGPGGASWGIPFTDVRDTVSGTILAMESPQAIGEAFNIVGPAPVLFVPAAKQIASATERPYREVRMPFLWSFYASINKARVTLGYQPQYDFPRMIESAVAFSRGENIGIVPV